MKQKSYTTGQAAKEAGISRSMLSWLMRQGLAQPGIRQSEGPGSSARWSQDDVDAIATMGRVTKAINELRKAESLPPIRLRQLVGSRDPLVIGPRGPSTVSGKTTIAQLLRAEGGAVAIVPAKLANGL